jgi:hypothetical protein
MAQRQQRELQLVQDLQRELKAVQDLTNQRSSRCMEQVPPSHINQHAQIMAPMAPMGITAPVHKVVEGTIPLEECAVEMIQKEELSEFQEVRFQSAARNGLCGSNKV